MTDKAIVVGYDGSDSSERALDWALATASIKHRGVTIVHVVPTYVDELPAWAARPEPGSDVLLRVGEQTLARGQAHASREAPDVAVGTRLATGGVVPALIQDPETTAMIVVGSRGLGGFAELLVGSTGIELAMHAPCPVVVLRPQTAAAGVGPDAGRVVVGMDGSSLSEHALEVGFEEAADRGVGLTAIHAWQAPFFDLPGKGAPIPYEVVDEEFRDSEVRALEPALSTWRTKFPSVHVRSVVVRSDPIAALVAASAGAELLVVGSRGRGGFRSLLLGSVSHGVLHHAHCPVAVVRPATTSHVG